MIFISCPLFFVACVHISPIKIPPVKIPQSKSPSVKIPRSNTPAQLKLKLCQNMLWRNLETFHFFICFKFSSSFSIIFISLIFSRAIACEIYLFWVICGPTEILETARYLIRARMLVQYLNNHKSNLPIYWLQLFA